MEDERKRLYELCRENGIDVHHKTGIPKLTELLVEAGIAFETADYSETAHLDPEDAAYRQEKVLGAQTTDPDIMDDKDVIAEMRDQLSQIEATSESKEEVERAREKVAMATEALDKKIARRKAQEVRKSDRVECVALTRFHVQKTDLGEADASGVSIKVAPGTRMMLPHGKAVGLEARGQVRIV